MFCPAEMLQLGREDKMNEKKIKNVLTEFRVSDNIYTVVAEI